MKIMIINRSFWPFYPVLGEALLQVAEKIASNGHAVSVVFQDRSQAKAQMRTEDRGQGVSFYPIKALTTSASKLSHRAFDAVFFMFWVIIVLLWVRPNKIYVSTDPPIIIPFIVMVYSRWSGSEFVYHLQDIHPEATNAVIPINKWVFYVLLKIDALTTRKANYLITITEQMAAEICSRSDTNLLVHVLGNPSVSFDEVDISKPKIAGFSFCGNAGRLQRIPLLLEAIENYFEQGGKQEFTFAGGGVHALRLRAFADKYPNFNFVGLVSPVEAAQLSANYTWALLPIEDSVTRFAFPSKSSSYVFSGAKILAICGACTSVAQWVKSNGVGEVIEPEVGALTDAFFAIEKGSHKTRVDQSSLEVLREKLQFDSFVRHLTKIVLG